MASFPPLKKSLFRIITVITIICLLVITCAVPASAYSNEQFPHDNYFPRVNLPCSRPVVDDNCMYVEVLTKQGSEFYVDLIVFELKPGYSDESYDLSNFLCHPIVSIGSLQFEFFVPTDSNLYWYCYSYNSLDGKIYFEESDSLYYYDKDGNVYPQLVSFTYPYSIYGVHYYGIDGITQESIPSFQVEFVVTYAGEGLLLNYLEYFKDTFSPSLTSLNSSISSLTTKFDDFGSQCLSYLYANISHLTNMESYLETLTEQNNQIINGPPGSDEEASPPPNVVAPPRDDSTVDDIKEAEKDAVGGKTDEEIKEDIKDTLDFEDKKDEVNGEEIETSDIEVSHNTFNLVFDFMGGAWNSYFILSLTIAFAAFLIGRRY